MEDGKPKLEMREDMGDGAARRPAGLEGRAAFVVDAVLACRPGRRRHLGHATEKAFRATLSQKHGTVGAFCHEGGTDADRFFGLRLLQRKALLRAFVIGTAARAKRAEAASRT